MFYTDLPSKLFWAKVQILGMALTSIWPLFIAHFTGKESLTGRRGVLVFSIVPAFTLGLLLTNDMHGLIFSGTALNYLNPKFPLIKAYGAGMSLFILYSYTVILGSCAYAIKEVNRRLPRYRVLPYIISVILLLPISSNLYYQFVSSTAYIDYTPTVFGIVSIGLILFAPSQLRVGTILPIDYVNILGKMKDIVVLVDENDQLFMLTQPRKM